MLIDNYLMHTNLIMRNKVLDIYQKLSKYPLGRWFFSKAVSFKAPYFRSISPRIIVLKHGEAQVWMKKKWSITNHLKSVHAIAMCNICEFAGGLCLEVSIPSDKRWIPKGMSVNYIKIARTDLTAHCQIKNVDWNNTDVLDVYVTVLDNHDVLVMDATINMKISNKKKH